MLEITFCKDDNGVCEVEIEASLDELKLLEQSISALSKGGPDEYVFSARTDFKPRLNQGWINELVLRRCMVDDGDIVVLAHPPERLIIEGSAEKLAELAGYFCFEPEDRYPEHHHCEWRVDHPCLSASSVPLIIWVAGTAKEHAAIDYVTEEDK